MTFPSGRTARSLCPTEQAVVVSMPVTWADLPAVEPEDFDVRAVPGLLAERGDPHSGMDQAVGGIETVLDWYAADDRDRVPAELPYPPDYPKMPGEPMRVQPSRARNNPTSPDRCWQR